MAQPFGHEKLIVYQKGIRFVTLRGALLDGLTRRVAACDHLDRGSESILVNIAHASNTWSPKATVVSPERISRSSTKRHTRPPSCRRHFWILSVAAGPMIALASKRVANCSAVSPPCSQHFQRRQPMSDTLNRTLNRHPYSDTLNRPASTEMQGLPLRACPNDHIDPQILRKTQIYC